MKLHSLIHYLLSGFIALIALAAIAFGVQFTRVQHNEVHEKLIFDLDNQLTALAGVQTEFLLDCNERARKQWKILHSRLASDIDVLLEHLAENELTGQSLRETHAARAQAFALICQDASGTFSHADTAAQRGSMERLAVMKLIAETQRSSFNLELLHERVGLVKSDVLNQLSLGYAVLWLLLGLLVGAAYLLLRRHVIAPLGEMLSMVDQFGHGNFDVRTAWHRDDELGALANALNAMATNVAELTVSTERYSAEVAERRRTEKALLFQLDRYRLIMEGAGPGIWDWDVVNKTVEYSSAWKSMRGYLPEDIGNSEKEWSAGIHPDDRGRVFDAVQAYFDGRDAVFDQEYRVLRKDGSWFWVRDVGALRRDEQGRVTRMAGSEVDISEQRLEKMRQGMILELTQHLLIEADVSIVYDKVVDDLQAASDFPIIALELYDPEHDEMVFEAFRGMPSLVARARVPADQTLSGMVVKQGAALIETNALAHEGYRYEALRALQVTSFVCVPLKLANGNILGTLSLADTDLRHDLAPVRRILSEIAERLATGLDIQRLREEARRNAQKVELIFDNMSEGLYYVGRDGQVIDCNPAACRLFGMSLQQFTARRIDDDRWRIIDESGRRLEPREFPSAQAFETGEPVFSQALGVYIQDKEDYAWMHFNAIPLFRSGDSRASEVFVTIHDVNERLQKERLAEKMRASLEHAQKMQSVGLLTGGIAHDFNNLLGIMLGHLELLAKDLSGQDEAMRRVRNIRHSAERAVQLVRQLLGFARQKPARSEVCSINEALQGIDQLIQRAVTPSVSIQWSLGQGLWLTEIDSGDFQDVVLNLANNARDAMPRGGELVIETANCELDEAFCASHDGASPGPYIRLSVRDNGVGIDAEQLRMVFEPFYTSKPVGKGTGLGLAMVYGFTKRSGGYVTVDSTPGQGATFTLYLPRAKPGGARTLAAPVDKPVQLARGDGTILVVDDEIQLQTLAREMLQTLGYRVLLASSAELALDVLAGDFRIDVLFSDVVMPGGMDGYELASQVRTRYPGIKILLTSGYSDKVLNERVRDQTQANLLIKPYSLAQLAQQMKELFADARAGEVGKDALAEFTWREEFSLGIASMDAEHKQIFELQRQLRDAIEQGGKQAIVDGIQQLKDAMQGHFVHEESLMRASHYPGLNNHREVHQMLLKQVHGLRDLALAEQLTVTAVSEFLNRWWGDHTQGMDRAYVPYVKRAAEGVAEHNVEDSHE